MHGIIMSACKFYSNLPKTTVEIFRCLHSIGYGSLINVRCSFFSLFTSFFLVCIHIFQPVNDRRLFWMIYLAILAIFQKLRCIVFCFILTLSWLNNHPPSNPSIFKHFFVFISNIKHFFMLFIYNISLFVQSNSEDSSKKSPKNAGYHIFKLLFCFTHKLSEYNFIYSPYLLKTSFTFFE